MTDAELCAAVQAGDRVAEAALVEKYKRAVWKEARNLASAGPGVEPEDLVQVGMLFLLDVARRGWWRPEGGRTFLSYLSFGLRQHMRRECRQARVIRLPSNPQRKYVAHERVACTVGRITERVSARAADRGPHPGERIEADEELEKLRRAIPRLGERDRWAIDGELADKTQKEAAAEAGCTREYVRQTRQRAHGRLAILMGYREDAP